MDSRRELVYRTLRAEEGKDGKPLVAKSEDGKPPGAKSEAEGITPKMLLEHLLHGSDAGYTSPFISTTADLQLALKFAGCLSRIAKIDLSDLKYWDLTPEGKRDALSEIKKEEPSPRDQISCERALMFAKRSQEVLILRFAKKYEILTATLTVHELHTLPGSARFVNLPQSINVGSFQAIEQFNSTNAAMKKVTLKGEGTSFIFRAPRMNVDLEGMRPFDEAVSAMVMEFLVLRFYREMKAKVLDCQLLIGALSLDELKTNPSPFAYLIFHFDANDKWGPSEIKNNDLREGFILDCLLGNWYVLGSSNKHIVYRGDAYHRANAERSMGIYYSEEGHDQSKQSVPFHKYEVLEITAMVETVGRRLGIRQDDIGELLSSFVKRRDEIFKAIDSMKTLATELNKKGSLKDVHFARISLLQNRFWAIQDLLNFQPVPHNPKGPEAPSSRDGHTSVLLDSYLWIFGGNSQRSALNDLWRFDLNTSLWEKITSSGAPSPRYSHTMTPWKKGFLIIGGCSDKQIFQDLFYFDVKTRKWTKEPSNGLPKLARHAACRVHDNIYVYGGHTEELRENEKNKKYKKSNRLFKLKSDLTLVELERCPVARQRHSLVNIGQNLWVVSGIGKKSGDPSIYAYSISNGTWTKIPVEGMAICRASNIVKVKCSDGKRKLVALGGGNPQNPHDPSNNGSQLGHVPAKEIFEIHSMTYSGDNDGVLKWQREEILGDNLAAVSSSQVFCEEKGLIYVFGGKRNNKWQFRLRTLRLGQSVSASRSDFFAKLNQSEQLLPLLGISTESSDTVRDLLKKISDVISKDEQKR